MDEDCEWIDAEAVAARALRRRRIVDTERTGRINVRCREDQLAVIDQAAARLRLSRPDYVRDILMDVSQEILHQTEHEQ